MAAKTEQFKSAGSNLGKTLGQSWSMIAGRDVPNYSLLFLDETLTRKRGEHETVFMPHIVLGRSSRCHVRYGDNYRTVSREHASITVDGQNFVLNHNPSASNPTYVNGRPVAAAHLLQNGDEIQLSSNGPKMRFNTTTLKTSTIGLTSRIGQAMSQAVKPYRRALTILGILLICSLAFAGWNIYQNSKLSNELIELKQEANEIDQQLRDLEEKGQENSAAYMELLKRKQQVIYRTTVLQQTEKETENDNNIAAEEEPIDIKNQESDQQFNQICEDDVAINKMLPKEDVILLVLKRVDISLAGKSGYIGVTDFYKYTTNNPIEVDRTGISYGTGFVTNNNKIVTARHVVQPWRYYEGMKDDSKEKEFWQIVNAVETNGGKVEATFDIITSNGKWSEQISFREGNISHDNDDLVDKSADKKTGKLKVKDIFGKDQKTKIEDIPNKTKVARNRSSDWVSLDFNIPGTIKMDRPKSQTLPSGQKLHILGYSNIIGVMDLSKWAGSSYSFATVSNDATLNKLIAVSGQNFGPGNSGGPAFICENGELICIGVVVAGVGTSNGFIVPVGQIRG